MARKQRESDGQAPLCRCGCGLPVEWDYNGSHWYAYVKGHLVSCKPAGWWGKEPPLCACGCGQPVEWGKAHQTAGWFKYVKGHYRKDLPYKDYEWLHQEYEVEQRTMANIAEQFGVNPRTITKAMHRLGIEARAQRDSLMISGAVKGERNPAWKGGTTPERQSAYHQGTGKEIIKAVYKRDGYACLRCGKPKMERKGLHAHHLKPWALCEEARMEMGNFVTLCRECHTWVHSKNNVGGNYIVL